MLLPSSIQRADDLVGIAMPIVGLLWAQAPLLSATMPRPANAATAIVFSPDIVYSLDLSHCRLNNGTLDHRSRVRQCGWPRKRYSWPLLRPLPRCASNSLRSRMSNHQAVPVTAS